MMGFWAPGKVGMRLKASLLVNRGRFGIGWTELDGESSACDLDLREAVTWKWWGPERWGVPLAVSFTSNNFVTQQNY